MGDRKTEGVLGSYDGVVIIIGSNNKLVMIEIVKTIVSKFL